MPRKKAKRLIIKLTLPTAPRCSGDGFDEKKLNNNMPRKKAKRLIIKPTLPLPISPRCSGDDFDEQNAEVIKLLAVIIFTGLFLGLIFTIAMSFGG